MIDFRTACCAFIIATAGLTACSLEPSAGQAPAAPGSNWAANVDVPVPAPALPEIAALAAAAEASLSIESPKLVGLPELVEFALSTNPLTRSTWLGTQSAYASLGIDRSEYYPNVTVGGVLTRSRAPVQSANAGNNIENHAENDTVKRGSAVSTDWLLFDFGAREARIEREQAGLVAANFAHNAAIQDVILQVERSFCQYVALRFLSRAEQAAVADAERSLDAAENRRQAGLATVSDTLQAKTALSKAQYILQSTAGQIAAVRGAVLTAAGLPPTAPVDVREISVNELAPERVDTRVEELIKEAQESSPQLASARAKVWQAQLNAKAVRRSGYPSLRFNTQINDYYHSWGTEENYSGGLSVTFPLFTGLAQSYAEEKAKLDAQRSAADYELLDDFQQLAVWTDYYAYQTATAQIKSSEDFLNSAQESYNVALGRYQQGVGSILDLLSAGATLEESRAAQVQAYADWFLALAQLRHDLGQLSTVNLQSLNKELNNP